MWSCLDDIMKKIRVLIVDDSALIRKVLTEIINTQPDMEAIGAAPDPLVAREMIRELNPDVLTLDVEMPKMDGLDFLEKLMRLRPMPVVMVSTLTEKGSEVTFRALELGAVDFISKPKLDIATGMKDYGNEIADKIRAAMAARLRRHAPLAVAPKHSADVVLPAVANRIASDRKADHRRRVHRRHRGHQGISDSTCRRIAPAFSSPSTCRRRSPSRSPIA